MNNDPLKEYVARNRAEFDDLEAPPLDMTRLRQQLAKPQEPVRPALPGFAKMKWLSVAAMITILAGVVLIANLKKDTQAVNQTARIEKNITASPVQKELQPAPVAVNHNLTAGTERKRTHRATVQPAIRYQAVVNPVEQQLSDSSSASNRLAAILAIDQSGLISESMVNKLAVTLQKDGNSNVRLAALGVMEKYKSDAHVSDLLIRALGNQNDPLVQVELVRVAGQIDDAKVNDRLYALVNNPDTFEAVKDEAYTILTRENK